MSENLNKEECLMVMSALDSAPFEILWINEDHTIFKANKTAQVRAEEQGLSLIDNPHNIVDPAFPEEILNRLFRGDSQVEKYQGNLQGNKEACRDDVLIVQDDGSKKYVIRYSKRILTADKNGFSAEMENKQLQYEYQQAIEEATRIRSQFIANMNHEIRTPMNAIIGYAEMLAGSDLDRRQRKFAETIYKSGMSLVAILNDIMDLSKIESGRLKIINSTIRLQDIFHEVISLHNKQVVNKNFSLHLDIGPEVPAVVLLDGTRLKQVLFNFVGNAIKFTNTGTISIIVQAKSIENVSERYDLKIIIKDTGIGISPEEQKILFPVLNPGNDSAINSTHLRGFGLALCGQLVAMMGGHIEMKSALGSGSEFTIHLPDIATSPLSDEDIPCSPQPSTEPGKTTPGRLLVVDDMDIIVDIFEDYFSSSEVEVLTASTGEEGLAKAIQKQPGIIFMDLNLPGKDGRSVTKELKLHPETKHIPVVVMTGNMLEPDDYQPLFDDYLQKPFRFDDLDDLLEKHWQVSTTKETVDTKISMEISRDYDKSSFVSLGDEKLELLLDEARESGSLTKAMELGNLMKKTGQERDEEKLTELGQELAESAIDHNIMSVERILNQLQRHDN